MDDFSLTILPEDTAPAGSGSCRRCELSTHGTGPLWGEGNASAPIFVILDNPGARVDKDGRPFLCGTRRTLMRTAHEAGLAMASLYITYILKCRPRRSYDKPTARSTCIKYLWEQLHSAGPDIVMCLGDVACQSFFENPDVSVKLLRGKVHIIKNYSTVVSYHPLAVRRRPVLHRYFLDDWGLVAGLLREGDYSKIPSDK